MSYDIGAFEKNLPDPETIRTAGTTLKTKATSFSTKATSTSTSWSRLQGKGVYSAPGDEVVFSAFTPITTAAEDLVTDIGTVKTATDGFADDVDTIKTKLAGIKADAASFESDIAGRSRDDWDDDEDLVKKEQNIIHGLNGLYADLQTAQMTCANAINAIYGGPTYVMVTQDGPKAGQIAYGYTNEQLDAASTEGNIPWGKPTEWDKPWYKDAWDGVCSFGKGVWSGVTGTVKGLWNMVNVTDMDTFKATWKGMGKLALNVAIVTSPVAQVALRATGHGDVVDKAGTELLAVGKAAIHWDDWKRDPAYAAGATTFDLATILLTAGGGAVAKAGSVAGKIAEVSNAGGKMATVLNATRISTLANVTIKGVDLVNMLKIKGITIATDGIKVAGTKIADLPVKISGGTTNLSTRMAAMADQLGLGGPRVATAGGHGVADAAGGASTRPTVMHLGADTPSRPTGTTGAHPGTGSGTGGRAVPEGQPRFGVRTEDGTPSGKPVSQGTHPDAPESGTAKPATSTTTHPDAPEGSTKPAAATTTHPDAPESGSAKPAAATTHPEAPEGSAKPAAATTTHPEAPEGSTTPAAATTHPDAPEAPEGPAKPAASTTHPEAPEGPAKPAASTTHPEASGSAKPAAAGGADGTGHPGDSSPSRTPNPANPFDVDGQRVDASFAHPEATHGESVPDNWKDKEAAAHYGEHRDAMKPDLRLQGGAVLPTEVHPSLRHLVDDNMPTYGVDEHGRALTESEYANRYAEYNHDKELAWDNYPDNAGAAEDSIRHYSSLEDFRADFGDIALDRVGDNGGAYLSVDGTPWHMRGLPVNNLGKELHIFDLGQLPDGYRLEISKIAPAFGRPGGGTQLRVIGPDNEVMRVSQLRGILNER